MLSRFRFKGRIANSTDVQGSSGSESRPVTPVFGAVTCWRTPLAARLAALAQISRAVCFRAKETLPRLFVGLCV